MFATAFRLAAVTWCLGAASGTALAGPAIISVTPSSVDDTAELQAALDACSAVTVPCRIELSAGIFHTDVLLVRDFHGALVGAGAGVTTVRPLRGVPLRSTSSELRVQDNTITVNASFSPGPDVLLLESTTGCVVREAAGTSVVDLGSNNTSR